MADQWIEDLAGNIRDKNREAAEEFGRKQHYAGVLSTRGNEYFVLLVSRLQENVDTLRRRLQGDPASAETALNTIKPDEVRITRARFPWVDARLTHRDDTMTLDYAKSVDSEGDSGVDRKTRIFAFRVSPDDALLVEDAFAEPANQYQRPEDLARHITELLFAA